MACCSLLPRGLSTSAGSTAAGDGDGGEPGGSKGSSAGDGVVTAGVAPGATPAAEAEVPMDARGLPRPKQRVEVELGTFHEFTAVNKNGG